ncbi:hypothetical protein QYE76_064695 [Lolium multiflorum]|uniref:Uncharacterized protein n=1 Tax=Lolium multiflorum TaxID=4521 RepID=A0AAD8S9G1_LOLMU|nr:hypothetical protein QYE76_064695 [Lolium multiflorum]
MSTSNRITKPGYESYQPVVAARQLGLGHVPPHFFLHHLTASRAELPEILTGQRCYTFFDALAVPIPTNLCFTTTTDGFETWWTMWKTHAFRRALGPSLKQLDAEHDPTHQEQDGPEPKQADGSPFTFLPPAPVVLFCRNSPSLKQVIMQGQPISPKSASKNKASSGPVAPRASTQARKAVRKVATRKTLKRKAPVQDTFQTSTEENSSEDEHSRQRDMNPGASERSTTQSQTDSPSSTRQRSAPEPAATPAPIKTRSRVKRRCVQRVRKGSQVSSPSQEVSNGCDPSSLLTFDPESIEPAAPKASEEPNLEMVRGPLQRLKALLSSSVEILVENPEAIKEKCQRLNEKKTALDAKADTSANNAELETLRKELESLEEKVRMTKQLIQEKETFIARSREEAQGLTADLKTDLAEIRALSGQLVTGKDEDDETEIAEVDRIRTDALRALVEFLQKNLSV